MSKKSSITGKASSKKDKIEEVKAYLIKHATEIEKQATKEHKIYLGGGTFRSELIRKYHLLHVRIIHELTNNLYLRDLKKGSVIFKELGEMLAQEAVQDGLTIEETVDGTIFLKQAIWKKIGR